MIELVWIERVDATGLEPDPVPSHVMPSLSGDDDGSFSSIVVLGLAADTDYRMLVDFDIGHHDGGGFARGRSNGIGALSIPIETGDLTP